MVDSSNKTKITLFGIFVHVLLFIAAADIYFSSPLDHGMNPVRSTSNPPAHRVVIFVADGLRAEGIFGDRAVPTPFLKKVRESMGSWGVSHTRVPTESRPGHVALFAGIYEDPSALFKGWKFYPVDFDHLMQQSTHSWNWGSPDIVNLFQKENSKNVDVFMYTRDMEDFGKHNTSLLDSWVFNHVEEFLKANKNNSKIHAKGNVFFLHLLGIDTAGHGFKPYSKEYHDNIKMVDNNTEKLYHLFCDTFKDNQTVFIFTSDHGMTNWGSHGAGSNHETETPFLIWGSGIKKQPAPTSIKQIDVSPLLASVIGVNIPGNSLGILPEFYFDIPEENILTMLRANIKQLLEILLVKKARLNKTNLFASENEDIKKLFKRIELLETVKHNYSFYVTESKIIMNDIVSAIDYYHNYFKSFILFLLSLGFLGWILYLWAMTVHDDELYKRNKFSETLALASAVTYLIGVLFVYTISLSSMFYLYLAFPLVMLNLVYSERKHLKVAFHTLVQSPLKQLIFRGVCSYLTIICIVNGFSNPFYLSAAVFIQVIWVVISPSFNKLQNIHHFQITKIKYILALIAVSMTPLLFINTSFNVCGYITGLSVLIFFYIAYIKQLRKNYKHVNLVPSLELQLLSFILSILWAVTINLELIRSNSSLKYFSYVLSIVPILLITENPNFVMLRFLSICLGFGSYYILTSEGMEILFIALYLYTLVTWISIESYSDPAGNNYTMPIYLHYKSTELQLRKHTLTLDDLRRIFIYVILIMIGYFGRGNTASINFFDPMWTKCFVTVFSPFTMSALIILKITVPFIYATCAYKAVIIIGHGSFKQILCGILLVSDIILIHFLFRIKNVGSWLEIGTSISYFVIMEAFIVIIIVLYGISNILTSFHKRLIFAYFPQ